MIPEDCEHHFPGGWCHLKHFWQATQDVSTALTHASSRAGNGEPKTHRLHRGSNGKGSHSLVPTAAQIILCCWFSGAETMGQAPQCKNSFDPS
jgi:hypothetical protein